MSYRVCFELGARGTVRDTLADAAADLVRSWSAAREGGDLQRIGVEAVEGDSPRNLTRAERDVLGSLVFGGL